MKVTEQQVRESVASAKRSLLAAAEQIVWQVENETWLTLGYESWDEMREAEYGGIAFMVPAGTRKSLSRRLYALGLTQQQIADTAGVSQQTVADDLQPEPVPEPESGLPEIGKPEPDSGTEPESEEVVQDLIDSVHEADVEYQRANQCRGYLESSARDLRLLVRMIGRGFSMRDTRWNLGTEHLPEIRESLEAIEAACEGDLSEEDLARLLAE